MRLVEVGAGGPDTNRGKLRRYWEGRAIVLEGIR